MLQKQGEAEPQIKNRPATLKTGLRLCVVFRALDIWTFENDESHPPIVRYHLEGPQKEEIYTYGSANSCNWEHFMIYNMKFNMKYNAKYNLVIRIFVHPSYNC